MDRTDEEKDPLPTAPGWTRAVRARRACRGTVERERRIPRRREGAPGVEARGAPTAPSRAFARARPNTEGEGGAPRRTTRGSVGGEGRTRSGETPLLPLPPGATAPAHDRVRPPSLRPCRVERERAHYSRVSPLDFEYVTVLHSSAFRRLTCILLICRNLFARPTRQLGAP